MKYLNETVLKDITEFIQMQDEVFSVHMVLEYRDPLKFAYEAVNHTLHSQTTASIAKLPRAEKPEN
jgi:hypothetical protein